MALVNVEDVVSRLDPQPDPVTYPRIELLIEDAETKIRTAFLKAGRDFDAALARGFVMKLWRLFVTWFPPRSLLAVTLVSVVFRLLRVLSLIL